MTMTQDTLWRLLAMLTAAFAIVVGAWCAAASFIALCAGDHGFGVAYLAAYATGCFAVAINCVVWVIRQQRG